MLAKVLEIAFVRPAQLIGRRLDSPKLNPFDKLLLFVVSRLSDRHRARWHGAQEEVKTGVHATQADHAKGPTKGVRPRV